MIGRRDHQNLLHRQAGVFVAADAAQRGGEANAGLHVAAVDIHLAGPEGGAGEGIQPVGLGALLGRGFARRGRCGVSGLGRRLGCRLSRRGVLALVLGEGGRCEGQTQGGCGERKVATHRMRSMGWRPGSLGPAQSTKR